MVTLKEEFSGEHIAGLLVGKRKEPPQNANGIHWSMRLMSAISLFALMLYTYVLWLCRKSARGEKVRHEGIMSDRVRLSGIAFGLDFFISGYFAAISPILLEKGGLSLDHNNMPRPLFWFFAVTGLVPTASMGLTVLGGNLAKEQIRKKRSWKLLHISSGIIAYFSWWLACAPIFIITLFGEKRTMEWATRYGF